MAKNKENIREAKKKKEEEKKKKGKVFGDPLVELC